MDKFSYNSYPDSTESSPRCREIDFENPSPWEDQQQQQTQSSYKVKFMCSYGGKIQPRPHDNQLTYVNGDTKILSVDRGIRFQSLVSKLSTVVNGGGDGGGGVGGEISFKYQLPGEDLDALISVTNDDDLEHMMHEYDRLLRLSTKPARMRLFLFPACSSVSGGFGSEGSTKSDRDLVNPILNRPESEKSVTAPSSNADFLFGSEKVAPIIPQSPSPVNVPIPVPVEQQRMIPPEVDPAEIQRQIHEFQRIQIIDQEQQIQQQQQHIQHQLQQQQQQQQQQQEEAMYRRKSEEGRYFSPATTTVSQTNQQPPIGYWQGNQNVPVNNVYTTTSLNPQEQQQVYMMQAQAQAQAQSQAPLYHSVMRPPVQGNQGYYPPVQQQYMEQQSQQGYNVVQQPQGPYSGGPQVMTSGAPMGSQMGNHVYYTVAGEGMMVQPPQQPPQPQYQGMGQPVDLRTGPDGKVVVNNNNMSPKVSDSV